ncbi:hypothetical protein [Polyangium jinanense]|uniref:Type I restriction enzyme R protein N-terminal domain-containing protein n=1 Tax=Polyangium jinanense TaxID=2829994 RepID=A0A9X4ANK8_9BACT|nr:hypothetical protein [Polyangium jinanense]MDC3960377.1 hypothetical protein [Polyangium jinanense]MDC3978998.1 hypothetical protein [Polyangium jinanense]
MKKEAIEAYVNRVKELADHVKGNEQATKQSLIGPLFTLLGYDLTDPRQCVPEYKVDFGKERSSKPIDWAFLHGGHPLFFVEAKEVGKKLAGYDEQLADYFAKALEVKLGILTNGVQWKFYTDLVNENVMDKDPFVTWDVLGEEPPLDLLTVLEKSEYNSSLLRTFAQRTRQRNLLIGELTRLLEPSPEFTRLAVLNIETRNLTAAVLDGWKPALTNAISEWAKQRVLSNMLRERAATQASEEPATKGVAIKAEALKTTEPKTTEPKTTEPKTTEPKSTEPRITESRTAEVKSEEAKAEKGKIDTTQEELDAFAIVQRMLGPTRPILYEDTASYFKIHIADRRSWVICRFFGGRKRPAIWVPLPPERATPIAGSLPVATTPYAEWSSVTMDSINDLERLGELFRTTWDQVKSGRAKADKGEEEA